MVSELHTIARTLSFAPAFDARAYTRTFVRATAAGELWLLGWLPGQATPIHDHGGVATASLVVEGALVEDRFTSALALASSQLRRAGDIDVHDRDDVHRVTALARSITLHLFAPRYVPCREYTS